MAHFQRVARRANNSNTSTHHTKNNTSVDKQLNTSKHMSQSTGNSHSPIKRKLRAAQTKKSTEERNQENSPNKFLAVSGPMRGNAVMANKPST